MPIVQLTVIQGYDEATRDRLIEAVTRAVRGTIDAPIDGITVVLNEVAAANYRRGGRPRTPGAARRRPADVVRAYLDAVERRDLDTAAGLLADEFAMVFPGGRRFSRLDELVAFAQARYRTIVKSYERIEEIFEIEETVVWCSGTLSGTWIDGSRFENVRFVDRFVVRDGCLARQEVWNDLAEMMTGRADAPSCDRE